MNAIRATFSDFRTVKTRKVAQLVMEVPIEQADDALRALGGVPRFDQEQWVGIAPIREDAKAPEKPERPKEQWDDMPASKQAAIRCHDDAFQAWFLANTPMEPTPDNAAHHLRSECGVASRSDIIPGTPALTAWHRIDDEFRAHVGLAKRASR